MKTDITRTWKPYLNSGEEVEKEFLAHLKKTYPRANKHDGKVKELDIVIPELSDLAIEIKRDLKSDETGNFGIEYFSWGKPSGIATTVAEVWVITDTERFYLFETAKLKEFMRNNWKYLKKTSAGDNDASKIILLRKHDAVRHVVSLLVNRKSMEAHIELGSYFQSTFGFRNRPAQS